MEATHPCLLSTSQASGTRLHSKSTSRGKCSTSHSTASRSPRRPNSRSTRKASSDCLFARALIAMSRRFGPRRKKPRTGSRRTRTCQSRTPSITSTTWTSRRTPPDESVLSQDRQQRTRAVLELARDDGAEERGGRAVVDGDPGEAAGQAGITVEDHDAVASRAADELDRPVRRQLCVRVEFAGRFARALDQHFYFAADEICVVLFADLVLNGQEFVVAAALHVFRNLVRVAFERLRSGTRAVPENEAVLKAATADEVDALREFALRFARMADDEVARHSTVRHHLANAIVH